MSTGSALLVALVLLILNAFFVGAEFALISARRSQIEPAPTPAPPRPHHPPRHGTGRG